MHTTSRGKSIYGLSIQSSLEIAVWLFNIRHEDCPKELIKCVKSCIRKTGETPNFIDEALVRLGNPPPRWRVIMLLTSANDM